LLISSTFVVCSRFNVCQTGPNNDKHKHVTFFSKILIPTTIMSYNNDRNSFGRGGGRGGGGFRGGRGKSYNIVLSTVIYYFMWIM